MYPCCLLLLPLALASTFAPPKGSPLLVSIETGQKGLNVGTGDRATFNLQEQFVPLSRAGKAVGDLDALRLRLAGVKNVARDRAPNAIVEDVNGETDEEDDQPQFPTPNRLMEGEWQEWTNWSGCFNGTRHRVRTCVSRRPAWGVTCDGEPRETTMCFDGVKTTEVAKDPWTIEKEITGGRPIENVTTTTGKTVEKDRSGIIIIEQERKGGRH